MTNIQANLFVCPHCLKNFTTEADRNRHWGAKKGSCYRKQREVLEARAAALATYDPHDPEQVPCDDEPEGGFVGDFLDGQGVPGEPFTMDEDSPPFTPDQRTTDPIPATDLEEDLQPNAHASTDSPKYQPRARRIVRRWDAGKILRKVQTSFEQRLQFEKVNGMNPYRGFKTPENFEHCEWLLHSDVSQRTETNLLRTRLMKKSDIPWKNAKVMLDEVDKLPKSTKWFHKYITVHENEDKSGTVRKVDLYYRDVVSLIRELMERAGFNKPGIMAYEPEEVFVTGGDGIEVREYSEANTGTWWADIQAQLPEGATVAPVILSSDKTQLSNFGGDKSAWPVYITIGNIAKETRRQVSQHAVLLLGYLFDDPLTHITDASYRSLAIKRLFHDSLSVMVEPLIKAGREGVEMVCADGNVRKVHPILASYICDHPEQCLVACIKNNHCPICEVPPKERGSTITNYPIRSFKGTINAIASRLAGTADPTGKFSKLGLRLIRPFWTSLPFVDPGTLFTPDILHQLHKGVFQVHLLAWMAKLMAPNEMDRRFQAITNFPGLRHFSRGVTHLKQTTGKEQKEMEKVLMLIIAGDTGLPDEAIMAASGLLNFIYLARYPSHTEETLSLMCDALKTFHHHKQVFLDAGVCKDFDGIPKLHSMQHYEASIHLKGSADGYSTEGTERLHIDLAKKGYRASNKNDHFLQMIKWLERQEAINHQRSYLAWCDGYTSFLDDDSPSEETMDLDVLEEEDDEEHEDDKEENGDSIEAEITESTVVVIPTIPTILDISADSLPCGGTYRLAKRAHRPRLTFEDIVKSFSIIDFDYYFFKFFDDHQDRAIYNGYRDGHTGIDVWTSFWLPIPIIKDVTRASRWHKITASPPHMTGNHIRKKDVPAVYSTVLILVNPEARGIQRYQAAQVRLIFRLSAGPLRDIYDEPLALVEFFSPLHPDRISPSSGLIILRRVWRQQAWHARIVTLKSIHIPVHVTPLFKGPNIPESWVEGTSHMLMEEGETFILNPFSSLWLYAFLVQSDILPMACLNIPSEPADESNAAPETGLQDVGTTTASTAIENDENIAQDEQLEMEDENVMGDIHREVGRGGNRMRGRAGGGRGNQIVRRSRRAVQ